nr:hypothetical protein [Micromonospora sp. DSM 115978]
MSGRVVPVSHPDWCERQRCGFVVPPIMNEMLPRHRGDAVQIGDRRVGGLVVTYLSSADRQVPVVAVFARSPTRGVGSAALRLSEVWRLARRLDDLLTRVGYVPGGDDDDEE